MLHENRLETQNITFAYKKHIQVLKGIDITFKQGEITALLGNNGCGKTTLLRIIAGITHQDSGYLNFNGKTISNQNIQQYKQSIGFMPEILQLYPEMKTREVLTFFSQMKGFNKHSVTEILDLVGLTPHASKTVKALSKGLKQRLNLAQAIIADPKVLIFDEPSNGFDCLGVKNFYNILKKKAKDGAIVIITTHQLAELKGAVDKIAILKEGAIVKHGTIEDFSFEGDLVNKSIWIHLDNPVKSSQIEFLEKKYQCVSLAGDRVIRAAVNKAHIVDLITECKEKGFSINNLRIEANALEETIEEYLV